jgi:hypothetical protein
MTLSSSMTKPEPDDKSLLIKQTLFSVFAISSSDESEISLGVASFGDGMGSIGFYAILFPWFYTAVGLA